MKHSPEYEKFKADAKDFAKAGWQLSKSGSKLARLLTKEYSDLAYQKSKEKRKSLSNSTRRNIKIALLAAPLLAGDAAPNAYFSKNAEKSDPKIEQIDNKEMLAELAEYKKLESKKFGTKLLQKKPERVKMLQNRNSDHKLRLMSFPEDSSEVGRIVRCLRWESLTDEAEKKYGLPPKLLLAMMAQEGMGDPTVPNISNWKTDKETGKKIITKSDGGLGLIHIQGANAEDYGLKVITVKKGEKNSRNMQDFELGDKIITYYNKTKDTKILAQYDDRRNPVLAVDVAARFLRHQYEKFGKEYENDAWIKALERYSGREWTDYAKKVINYRVMLDDYAYGEKTGIPQFSSGIDNVVQSARKAGKVHKLQKSIDTIAIQLDGKEGGFDEYLAYFQNELDQYGFQEYKKYQPQAK